MIKTFLAQIISAPDTLPKTPANGNTISTVLTIVFVILGALAVFIIIVAGFILVISGGDTSRIATARRAIVYASVGLVVAASAGVITQLIVNTAS